MLEGVLGDVGDTAVGVLPHLTRSCIGLKLTSQQLDRGRLAGSVDSNTGSTRRERDLDRDVVELGLLSTGVCERDVVHLHDGLALGCDAEQLAGLGGSGT